MYQTPRLLYWWPSSRRCVARGPSAVGQRLMNCAVWPIRVVSLSSRQVSLSSWRDEFYCLCSVRAPVSGPRLSCVSARAAILRRLGRAHAAIIAEIKKASPSKGVLSANFDAARIATAYQRGASAFPCSR